MTNTINQILVQNVETFETITRLTVDFEEGQTVSNRVDQYFSENDYYWGIVSLEDDADGEYSAILLVAAVDGPDFVMDMETGEMEPLAAVPAPVEDIIADDEAAITIEIDEPIVIAPVAFTAPKTTAVPKAKAPKKGNKQYEVLSSFISANPGVSRTTIFSDAGLLAALRTPAAVALINAGDKAETKRWNRRLNFLIRDMRRGGVDIKIERDGRVAQYTVMGSTQLELPFTPVAVSRNSAIIGMPADDEDLAPATPIIPDTRRQEEPQDVMLGFEDLLAQLDEDEATVLSDDQVAFKAAREMIK